jgi:hypothetical protein
MTTSLTCFSRSILLSVAVCATALAAVPTAVTIAGHVTGSDSHSVQIDGISYPLEAGSVAARELSAVQKGDAVTIQISPRRVSGTVPASNLVSAGHEVVHPATAKTQTTIKVVHAPGVR